MLEPVVDRGGATFPARWCCRETPGQAWEAGEHRGTDDTPIGIAVTGFDDWDVMALASRPRLTTVNLRHEDLGRFAGKAFLNLIAGREISSQVHKPTLVIRASTIGSYIFS